VPSSPTATDAAAALLVAYASKHPGEGVPSENAIVLPLAQLMGEGSLSPYFRGTNNLGAMHATQSFAKLHAADPGYGMVAFLDHGPSSGAYVTRMSVYPSLSVGARSLLDLVERMVDLSTVADASDYSRQLYAHGYYEGFSSPATPLADRPAAVAAGTLTAADLENIDGYTRLLSANEPAAVLALHATQHYSGDPSAVTSGAFAPLADRLTPAASYAPHTLEHARALLGAAADHPPPGGISLADALASPGGDGAWSFGPGGGSAAPSGSSPSPGAGWGELVFAAVLSGALVVGAKFLLKDWRYMQSEMLR
jgi:hypothetical protein